MGVESDAPMASRPRNPQDSTLRNVRAATKRGENLLLIVKKLRKTVHQLRVRVDLIEGRLSK